MASGTRMPPVGSATASRTTTTHGHALGPDHWPGGITTAHPGLPIAYGTPVRHVLEGRARRSPGAACDGSGCRTAPSWHENARAPGRGRAGGSSCVGVSR
jgi:hypothetical protein